MVYKNRSGGVKAGPLVWGRQFIFCLEVIFEVCGGFGGSGCNFGGSGWRWRLKG